MSALTPGTSLTRSRSRRARLRNFLLPDGRTVHVADNPSHAAELEKTLASSDVTYEVHLVGSDGHLEALRTAHGHHSAAEATLAGKHGQVWADFQTVRGHIDGIEAELQRIDSNSSSHTSGAMGRHFSRFGYDANIKVLEAEEDGDHTVKPLRIFNVPVVRQYFYKGILWRASELQEVQSFELFIDLLYVGIIAVNGDLAGEDADGMALLRFVITFTLSFKIWTDITVLISWFKNEDLFGTVSILTLLICLFGFTTNITNAFDGTYDTMIGYYLAARIYTALYVTLVAWLVPMVRAVMMSYAILATVGIILWIISIHVVWPYQLIVIWPALYVDLSGPTLMVTIQAVSRLCSVKASEKLSKLFDVYPAMNIEHRHERTCALVTLVFGYTVVAMMFQSTVNGIDAFFGKGALGLIQCFCFNWLFFEFDNNNLEMHAMRRSKGRAFGWSIAQLPFIMSFILGGGALARLVVADDCADANADGLSDLWKQKSESEIKAGIRWFYCGGIGVALIFMGIMALTHTHKQSSNRRCRKAYRMAVRFTIAVIIICLALADNLDSLELVGIVTALIGVVLGTELWAAHGATEKIFCTKTHYIGHCNQEELQAIQVGREIEKLPDGSILASV